MSDLMKVKVYGLADLHLSFLDYVEPGKWHLVEEHKPMNCFGPQWERHFQKIFDNWTKTVTSQDVVLVPGDISWALKPSDAVYDLYYLSLLPGKIIAVQGNHDYWWQGITKVRRMVPPNMEVIQNDCVMVGKTAICGTRGWLCPNESQFTDHDAKIYAREQLRLQLSLQSAPDRAERIVVMMHYMPTNEQHEKNGFIALMQQYGVSMCVYGHLHAQAHETKLPDECWGIKFHLVSADYLDFRPLLLWQETG